MTEHSSWRDALRLGLVPVGDHFVPMTTDELDYTERRLGWRLPEDYRDFAQHAGRSMTGAFNAVREVDGRLDLHVGSFLGSFLYDHRRQLERDGQGDVVGEDGPTLEQAFTRRDRDLYLEDGELVIAEMGNGGVFTIARDGGVSWRPGMTFDDEHRRLAASFTEFLGMLVVAPGDDVDERPKRALVWEPVDSSGMVPLGADDRAIVEAAVGRPLSASLTGFLTERGVCRGEWVLQSWSPELERGEEVMVVFGGGGDAEDDDAWSLRSVLALHPGLAVEGSVPFAADGLGDLFVELTDGRIGYVCYSAPEFSAVIADSFDAWLAQVWSDPRLDRADRRLRPAEHRDNLIWVRRQVAAKNEDMEPVDVRNWQCEKRVSVHLVGTKVQFVPVKTQSAMAHGEAGSGLV